VKKVIRAASIGKLKSEFIVMNIMNQMEDAMASPVTNKLIDWDFTRDSALWVWGRLTTGASIIVMSGEFIPIETYIGPSWRKVLVVSSVIIMWLAGKYDSSPLPPKRI
jgi:hypothetical protein